MDGLLNALRKQKISFTEHCPIAKYSTFRIGGTARLAVFPQDREQMLGALTATVAAKVDYAVVGKGSNLLFPDGEYGGVLIFTTHMTELKSRDDEMEASAGTALGAVAIRARQLSLSGSEFAGGIPGTVGGAVLMNAGAFGRSMADIITWVECWNAKTNGVERYASDLHEFGYRTSRYAKSPHLIILGAGLRLCQGDQREIDGLMEDYRRRRLATQPLEYPNAGSIFKNPDGQSAGKLIEDCGLKGLGIGGACVSEKHANFIVNKGGATARDVKALVTFMKQRVREQTGVVLECELRVLGRPNGIL